MDAAKAWQTRTPDALYPIVYLDCIHEKTHDAGAVRAKSFEESQSTFGSPRVHCDLCADGVLSGEASLA